MHAHARPRRGRSARTARTDSTSEAGSVEGRPQDQGVARVAQLDQRLRLDLAGPLARDADPGADLLERPAPVVLEAEAQPQDDRLARQEPVEHVLDDLPALVDLDRLLE